MRRAQRPAETGRKEMNDDYTPPESSEEFEVEPFDGTTVELSAFEPSVPMEKLATTLRAADFALFPFFQPIETLSVVQADAVVPRASFDFRVTRTSDPALTRNPAIQIHFEPSAYGITAPSNYVVEFSIDVLERSVFRLQGLGGSGATVTAGPFTFEGPTTVRFILPNVTPGQEVFAFLEQTSGGRWNWFQTQVRFPPLVVLSEP
jgi:hypothetical protein